MWLLDFKRVNSLLLSRAARSGCHEHEKYTFHYGKLRAYRSETRLINVYFCFIRSFHLKRSHGATMARWVSESCDGSPGWRENCLEVVVLRMRQCSASVDFPARNCYFQDLPLLQLLLGWWNCQHLGHHKINRIMSSEHKCVWNVVLLSW